MALALVRSDKYKKSESKLTDLASAERGGRDKEQTRR
jgi:hypothetical protein